MIAKNRKGSSESPGKLTSVTKAFLANSASLQAFLRKFLHRQQDIEDVAQEAYLKAYMAEKVKDIEHPKAFLFTIAKNLAINELRKKTVQITDYIEECKTMPSQMAGPNLEHELEARQSLGLYCEAIAALPERCRRVYLLRRVHGLRQQEIATSLGISLRMVEKHLQKGTLECREFIKSRQGDQSINNHSSRDSIVATGEISYEKSH